MIDFQNLNTECSLMMNIFALRSQRGVNYRLEQSKIRGKTVNLVSGFLFGQMLYLLLPEAKRLTYALSPTICISNPQHPISNPANLRQSGLAVSALRFLAHPPSDFLNNLMLYTMNTT